MRRVDDHLHPEYWEVSDQRHYEERIGNELQGLRRDVKSLADRVLMLIGALGLLAFILPIVAPFIRTLFQVPVGP